MEPVSHRLSSLIAETTSRGSVVGRPLLVTRFYECGLRKRIVGGTVADETGGKTAWKAWINTSILHEHSAASGWRRYLYSRIRTLTLAKSTQESLHRPILRLLLSHKMYWVLFLSVAVAVQASVYLSPPLKEEQLLIDTLLRELINQMGNELVDTADSYLEYQDKPKEIPMELPADYDGIDTLNPNPSIRDQEYLQHSTLWSHQRVNNNDKVDDRQRIKPGSIKNIKDEKENALPAYCTPPNPCPIGYTSENNCIVNFENTAAFSRDYQSAQDCMCDTEHMLDCPVDSANSNSMPSMHIPNPNFNQIVDQFQAEENPFFRGEKLPIAAKKGLNVVY